MHTILGAGGPVANALTRELIANNETIRLVSRRPSSFKGENITWKKADLLNYDELLAAAEGSEVIYLCAGLTYDKKIWKAQWPVIMQNCINLTKATGARLIFFDNIYMYGPVQGPMTENTPYKPTSVKGKVRAGIAAMLMEEARNGSIRASILRAPDFYGTDNKNSFYDQLVLDKLAKGQNAQWMGNPRAKHNFIYIPDAGKAMYLLGQHPEADNQVWHAPTAAPMTGIQFIELAAEIYGAKPKYSVINKLMLRLVGLFNKQMYNMIEMFYQFDRDYFFDSTKFERHFNFKPTSYRDGVTELSKTLYQPVNLK
ncbi:NAD-dependent epimerase/dehydratase family protein [Mucilaginibacter sp. RS28]|uniref:NAD-dependent epimerase/dehydratase family protein n=1 Tax=Mucilaginibacter straminoryzae TaxID=2932774 RepID=A0A9X1X3D9_9SPHI|nr:NAD-dependent epimerase/dehydratase family protein [Mucilaginibacter straminoryzae]MCJ8210161.1 NAD-dependent epimerase/dehydratase family protein [Mucilaginibacter straminoryzae]